jgi:hypothetical protein
MKGTIEAEDVEFEEFETQSDKVDVPVSYISKMLGKKLQGKFSAPSSKGVFEIDLNKPFGQKET